MDSGASNSDVCEVIITGPDEDWLVGFTRQLVTDRLAAITTLFDAALARGISP